jgi:hypothetical protein
MWLRRSLMKWYEGRKEELEKSKLTLNHGNLLAGAGTIVFHSRLLRLPVVGGGKLYSLMIVATGPKRCVTGSELPDQVVRRLLFCRLHSRKFRETPHTFPSLPEFGGRDRCLSLNACQCMYPEMHPFFAGMYTMVLDFTATKSLRRVHKNLPSVFYTKDIVFPKILSVKRF